MPKYRIVKVEWPDGQTEFHLQWKYYFWWTTLNYFPLLQDAQDNMKALQDLDAREAARRKLKPIRTILDDNQPK